MSKTKYYKKDDKIIIEIPFWSKRWNSYMPDEDVGEHPTLTGMIYKEKGEERIGFAHVIDMSHKGKADQETDIVYYFDGEKEEFIKLCKELEIGVIEYPICAYCGESIFGSYTMSDKGNMCHECQLDEEGKHNRWNSEKLLKEEK